MGRWLAPDTDVGEILRAHLPPPLPPRCLPPRPGLCWPPALPWKLGRGWVGAPSRVAASPAPFSPWEVGGHPGPLLRGAPVLMQPAFGAAPDTSPVVAVTWGVVAVASDWSCSGPVQMRESGGLTGRYGSGQAGASHEGTVHSGVISLGRNGCHMHTAPGPPGRQVCPWPSARWRGAPWLGLSASLPQAFPGLQSGTRGGGQGTGVHRGSGSQWLLPFRATESVT